MKIAILGDCHFGMRGDSIAFHNHYREFYTKTFFPYLVQNGITTIFQLGDLFDRRKYISFQSLALCRNYFFDQLVKNDIQCHVLLGNHDIFYKNTSNVNSLRELFSEKFVIHEKPVVQEFDGRPLALVPWINKENEGECLDFIRTAPADILCGHLELHGFNVLKNTPFDGGMNPDIFKRYSAVYTGHFHCRHSRDNVHYLGCPYQITMNDYGDKKGFHVLDTDTGDLEFIPNPYTIFTQLRYNDKDADPTTLIEVEESRVKGKFVRVVVETKTKPYLFEKFVDSLYAHQPQTVTVIEDLAPETVAEENVDLTEDTITIINREIDGLQNVDASRLKTLLRELYAETQALENTKQQ